MKKLLEDPDSFYQPEGPARSVRREHRFAPGE
jgi:hypothetical protein